MPHVANAPRKPLIIDEEGKARCKGHEIGGKSDWEVTVVQGSECHLTFVKGIVSSTDQIYHLVASRLGHKFDRSMTFGKLLDNYAQLFIFIS